jgi:ribosomal protein S18 acetylase RimI-like enzyme
MSAAAQKLTCVVRRATADDVPAIAAVYRLAAAYPVGLGRTPDEVSEAYVADFVEKSLADGEIFIALFEGFDGVSGEVHAYRNPLARFRHVLTHLTTAVHPDVQGRGVGRALFTTLLDTVRRERPDILRVELLAAESNERALRLYESVGFVREGRMIGTTNRGDGGFDADIPMGWYRPA